MNPEAGIALYGFEGLVPLEMLLKRDQSKLLTVHEN